jgi:aspartate kinase
MALIIQKFGGTSVADERARGFLVEKVRVARARGDRVVLVVSAMGRRGAPYATDTLLDLLREADPSPDPVTSDLLVSSGEVISACLLAARLRALGIPASPMTAYTAGIRAEGPAGDATPVSVDAAALRKLLDTGIVPVVTGFQGLDPQGRIVTLGRGGSDTSAVAVGVALGSDFVDIYTDVPGVAKADPRVAKNAPYMDFLDYSSMFRLASHGARVLHDRSALLAERGKALLRIRSTFDEGEGTLVGPEGTKDGQGKERRVPDFIGLGSVSLPEGGTRLTAVFAKGRLDTARIATLSGTLGFEGRPAADDPDALRFACPADRSAELTRSLLLKLL